MTRILEVTQVNLVDEQRQLPETTSFTKPLPLALIGEAISDVVARADRDYALELVTMLQVKARIADDTGERLTLSGFAEQEGFDLAQLRAAE